MYVQREKSDKYRNYNYMNNAPRAPAATNGGQRFAYEPIVRAAELAMYDGGPLS